MCKFGVIRHFFVTMEFFPSFFLSFCFFEFICILILGFELLLYLITLTDTHTHSYTHTRTHLHKHTHIHIQRHFLETLCIRDRPISMQNIHKRNIHDTGHIPTRTASNQAAAGLCLRRAANGIADCGFTGLKVRNWLGGV